MRHKFLKILFFLALIIGAWFILRFVIGGPEDAWICVENTWVKHGNPSSPIPESGCGEQAKTEEIPVTISEPKPVKEEPKKDEQLPILTSRVVLLDVPFLAQAPFGQWDDPVYQDACEEASLLTAILWVRGVKFISKEEATQELKKIADFELEKYGNYNDHSAADTVQIMKDYFNYSNIEARYDVSAINIISELEKGNLIIVPVNGQTIGNPYYTAPGPDRHMLPIIGYDYDTREFITNDVGTRQGEKFRYDEDVLLSSIRNYPTGHKEPITVTEKVMIVIWK